jgi:hypothetical protein
MTKLEVKEDAKGAINYFTSLKSENFVLIAPE